MKPRNFIFPLMMLLVLFAGVNVCYAETECPVKIELIPPTSNKSNYSIIQITSVVNSVTITDLIVNRGNNKVGESWLPEIKKELKFGQSVRPTVYGSNSILEIEIQTNLGSWTFTFK